MPNGELRLDRNTERVSAMPSPSASRSRVMRLALGTAEPAFFIIAFITQPLMPEPSSGRGGPLVSATNVSPLGRTRSHRGWARPAAKALTAVPSDAVGFAPGAQPVAVATSIVGI